MIADVGLTFNLDAELFWLGVDPSAVDRPATLSIGRYGITRGVDRIRRELDAHEVQSTWFVPGCIAERHPDVVKRISADGHEIGSRAWDATSLAGRSFESQHDAILSGIEVLSGLVGASPAGFRAPNGEIDETTFLVLKDLGVSWSSSLRGGEEPCEVFVNDSATLLDIGSRWELTDYVYFTFNFEPAFPHGKTRIASYSAILNDWTNDARETTKIGLPCVFTLTPDVIGKPGKNIILRRLIETLKQEGRSFSTMSRIAGI